jgi:hypothetical protein
MSKKEKLCAGRRTRPALWLTLCFLAACLLALPASSVSAQTPCAGPRVRMKTLLDGVQVVGDGRLSIEKLYAVCLPDPVRRGETNYAYNPYDGGKLSTTLKSSNGQSLNTYVWYAEKIGGLWELSRYEVVGGPKAVKQLTPGSYTLEFAVEDKVFQRFPFSFSTVEGKDVYRPSTINLVDGPWANYAEIYFPKPDRFTQLWVWLRDKDNSGPRPRSTPHELKLVRESDGKTLAVGDGSALILRPDWEGFKLSFRPPGGPAEFPAAEILKADGVYRAELSLDGKPYGSYRFRVKGGKFERDAAEAREAGGALMPLENDANYWSLKRSTP